MCGYYILIIHKQTFRARPNTFLYIIWTEIKSLLLLKTIFNIYLKTTDKFGPQVTCTGTYTNKKYVISSTLNLI